MLNLSTSFHASIESFLQQYLEFVSERSGLESDVRASWRALGVAPEVADELVRTDLRWDGRRFRVHDSLADQPDGVAIIGGLVLYLMRWCKFSETR